MRSRVNLTNILRTTKQIAPAFFATRAFGFSAGKGAGGVSASASVGHNTTTPGSESEQSIAVRLFGSLLFPAARIGLTQS